MKIVRSLFVYMPATILLYFLKAYISCTLCSHYFDLNGTRTLASSFVQSMLQTSCGYRNSNELLYVIINVICLWIVSLICDNHTFNVSL